MAMLNSGALLQPSAGSKLARSSNNDVYVQLMITKNNRLRIVSYRIVGVGQLSTRSI
jgi:hypothetical protein